MPADPEDNETSAGPGKSANSPAHRARSFIAQFQALNETQDSPFKSFGHIVSQLAQGRTFEEIFAPYSVQQEEDEGGDAASLSTDNAPALLETVVEGEEEDGALVVSGDPAPNLLETFLENEDEEGETVTTGS